MSQLDDEEIKRLSDVEGDGDDLQQEEPFDSSEEEEDDDEEEIERIRDGFIVDDEDEEGEKRRKKKHKRRHQEREVLQQDDDADRLDEDDLDLVMENSGIKRSEKSKFKRLKRATSTEDESSKSKGINDFFSDDEDVEQEEGQSESRKSTGRHVIDELDDFIEDDEMSDMDEEEREEVRQRRKQERLQPTKLSGIDSEKVDELYEIFGDGEDYAWALEGEDEDGEFREDDSKPQLQDIYEPEELKARMLTDGDKIIRDTDVPERYQELRRHIKQYELSDDDFNYEKTWIGFRLEIEKNQEINDRDAFFRAVSDSLTFIARQNLEVPFIFSHRRDYLLKTTITGEGDDAETKVETLLVEDDLWRIVQLDIEFHSLLAKRKQVGGLIDKLDITDDVLTEHFRDAININDFQDIYDYIYFEYSQNLKDLNLKKAHKSNQYDKLRSDKLFEIVEAFGISVKDAVENITTDSSLHPTLDEESSPLDLAEAICSDENSLYAKPTHALEAVKHFYAEELFNNVKLRKHLRNLFHNYSVIDIVLTAQGKLKIDKNSPYADFKYAINRNLTDLIAQPDLFLRMLEAESLNLVEIKLNMVSADKFLDKIFDLIKSDGQSDVAIEWNNFRRATLELSWKKILPLVSLHIKEDIRRVCERLIFFSVRASFLTKVDQAPYQPKRNGTGFGSIPRVFAISPGNGQYGADSIIGSFVDEFGKVVETFKFDENPMLPPEKLAPGDASFEIVFSDAIRTTEPDVIVINGFNVRTHKLFQKIKTIIDAQQLRVDTDELIEVIYGNDEVATRYMGSQKAAEEFPDKSSLVRYTIAMARYVQSPLLEYVSLGEDIKSLSIHEHQDLLSEERLNEAIESVLVDVVNMVGVDINKCVTSNYLAALLPYISGLGDRKAFGLLRAVQQHPLFSRQALITNDNIRIGSTIFLNCASFLKIPQNRGRAIRSNDDIEAVTLLDDTRIHPEDYALAEKMAADALDLDEDQIEDLKDAPIGETIIDKLMDRGAEVLHSLILEDYSRQLEESFNKKKRATLQMILEELQEPFGEIRRNFHYLKSNEIFQTLTGETVDTFYEGMVIPVLVKRDGKYDTKAVTSTMIECSARKDFNNKQEFIPGQTLQAKVLKADYENFTAEISFNEQDVKNPQVKKTINKQQDKWDFAQEQYDDRSEQIKEQISQKTKRVINHPLFQNFNAQQAQTFLAPKERGAVVIRPSSKGNDHIAVTWKVDNNLYQHIDVVEYNKENDYSLGKTLAIGNIQFADLDQIIYSYIGDIVKNINQLTVHDKYHAGTRDEVTQWLENYSKANPKRGCYAFALNHKKPGYFLLLFKTSAESQLFNWNVKVVPDGFELNGHCYSNVLLLCNGFKTLIKNGVSNPRPRQQNYQPNYQSNYQSSYNSGYNAGGYGGQSGYGGYGNNPGYSSNAGYNSGYNGGYNGGSNVGYNAGYNAGY